MKRIIFEEGILIHRILWNLNQNEDYMTLYLWWITFWILRNDITGQTDDPVRDLVKELDVF